MGEVYAEGVILDLEAMWEESDKNMPLVCFLSMGSDPTSNIESLAKKLKLECRAISMGQGQEIHARRLLQQSMNQASVCACMRVEIGVCVQQDKWMCLHAVCRYVCLYAVGMCVCVHREQMNVCKVCTIMCLCVCIRGAGSSSRTVTWV